MHRLYNLFLLLIDLRRPLDNHGLFNVSYLTVCFFRAKHELCTSAQGVPHPACVK